MQIHLSSPNTLGEAAKQFINALGMRRIVAFYGKMGVGKTTFIRPLCEELGVTDVVNSPTFAIVNEYEGKAPFTRICHFDFYRIKKLEEVFDMGYEDYFYSGALCLMEWPELVEDILPDDTVRITITELDDHTRLLTMAE